MIGIQSFKDCPPQPPLAERALFSGAKALELARIFEVLASETRLRLLHALVREKEAQPSALAALLGMKPQGVNNQLQRLADRGIVQTRREGNFVYYRVVDACLIDLIDRATCLLACSSARSDANGGGEAGEWSVEAGSVDAPETVGR